ncbi:amidohydrolase family protein [Mycolicibacter algericus]|uniref:amidohydrolase family protein n=1 Tax=Mycolicibacter algericus TaxID=1288388 RepID=UPI0013D2236F|nr:amidohydrolase family protein [Mycolicibacter algericus]
MIRNGLLLTQEPSTGAIVGDIRIVDGRIDAVGDIADEPGARVIDATGKAVLPGFVDTHRHTWQGAFRLIGYGWDFPTYRRNVQLTWGPQFTPNDAYIGELVGALVALNSGITTIRDESHIQNSPSHSDAVICALRDSGIRAVFAHGWPSVDSDAWMLSSTLRHLPDIERIRREILSNDHDLVTLNAMLRGPDMSVPDVVADDLAMARDLGVRSSMHIGWRPGGIRQLHDSALLGEDMLFIHCCNSTDDELRMLADAGASASVASTIELSMPGLGLPATDRLLANGCHPGLSVDTEVCVAGDMFTAMRAAQSASVAHTAMHPRLGGAPPSSHDLLAFATRDGAAAAGLADRIGTITVGKDADLIIIDLNSPNLAPVADAVSAIVAAATPHDVKIVMVRGQILKDSTLTHPGLGEVYRRAITSRTKILGQPPLYADDEPFGLV